MRKIVANNFQLSKNIERYLAVLTKVYSKQEKRMHQEILVNAQIRIHEEWTYDNWNGGTYGHALYLVLPEQLYLDVDTAGQRDTIEEQLRADINEVHHTPNEHIARVFLEMEIPDDHDWRRESGALRTGKRWVPAEAERRIWNVDGFRLFLSHKSEVKKETADLKERLQVFGVSCFVAHADILPTKEWQDEIENALGSMEGFAALLTEQFHDSDWTDQEVGYALARGIPLIAVRLGADPYGFIGKFQGLTTTWDNCAEDLAKHLIKHDGMLNAYLRALRRCTSFTNGNTLAKVLPSIERLSHQQIQDLIAAYNSSIELQGSFGFNGKKRGQYGPGLVSHLNRLSEMQFKYGKSGVIEPVKQTQ